MAVADTVQVRCPRCKSKFRDKAGWLRSGHSRQCPSCECMIFFEEDSPNKDIHAALREAERVRKALREEAAEKIISRTTLIERADSNDTETGGIPTMSRRQIDRRSRPGGRS